MASPSTARDRKTDPVPTGVGAARWRRPLDILFVHRYIADVERCLRELKKTRFEVSAEIVLTPEQFAERIATRFYDLVLAEYPSPNWQPGQALEILRLSRKQIPLIFVTSGIDLEAATELTAKGAAECVPIDYVGHLPVVIRRALDEMKVRGECDRAEKELRHPETHYRALEPELEDRRRKQSARDLLTGLANYRQLVDVLDLEIKRSKRTGREFALLLFDVDRLKQINDRYGRNAGSKALCRVADVLCISCRDIDTAARFGGDEFALVLPEAGAEAANQVALRVCDKIGNDGNAPQLSVSVGIAIFPKDAQEINTLLCSTDLAKYSLRKLRSDSRL